MLSSKNPKHSSFIRGKIERVLKSLQADKLTAYDKKIIKGLVRKKFPDDELMGNSKFNLKHNKKLIRMFITFYKIH